MLQYLFLQYSLTQNRLILHSKAALWGFLQAICVFLFSWRTVGRTFSTPSGRTSPAPWMRSFTERLKVRLQSARGHLDKEESLTLTLSPTVSFLLPETSSWGGVSQTAATLQWAVAPPAAEQRRPAGGSDECRDGRVSGHRHYRNGHVRAFHEYQTGLQVSFLSRCMQPALPWFSV